MELDARLTLPGDLRSPAQARRFVARTLTPLLGREDVETAMLLTSELVTNATLHAGTRCELVLRGGVDTLHIRVSDGDTRPPAPRRSISDELATGRGLRLLEVLCRRWGVEPGPAGKTVWCDLRVRG
ncbi:MAG: ATP-binding protein [Actinobacteria bacterium]|nr:ATP-binding protein [Actinomycetota bacterium]MCA1720856.1 ATP-binding protein [Actinomycetota bacterium]